MLIDTISQYGIMILGPLSIFLVSLKNKNIAKWGFVVGLIHQPFWFIMLYVNQQWPVFIVAFLYTYSWGQGFYNHFIKKGEGND
jgi:hypothetical protein